MGNNNQSQTAERGQQIVEYERNLLNKIDTIGMTTTTLAETFARSGYFDIGSLSQAIVKIEIGKALDILPIASMQGIHIFPGSGGKTNIQLGYIILGSLLRKSPDYDYEVIEQTPEICTVQIIRIVNGERIPCPEYSFTWQEATQAGLTSKSNWKYRKLMLFTVALAHAQRMYAPDVTTFAGYAEGENIQSVAQDTEYSILDEKDGSHKINAKPEPKQELAPVQEIKQDTRPVHKNEGKRIFSETNSTVAEVVEFSSTATTATPHEPEKAVEKETETEPEWKDHLEAFKARQRFNSSYFDVFVKHPEIIGLWCENGHTDSAELLAEKYEKQLREPAPWLPKKETPEPDEVDEIEIEDAEVEIDEVETTPETEKPVEKISDNLFDVDDFDSDAFGDVE